MTRSSIVCGRLPAGGVFARPEFLFWDQASALSTPVSSKSLVNRSGSETTEQLTIPSRSR